MGKWPYLIRGVRDVNVASEAKLENTTLMAKATLAMTIADVLSDRIAIASNGTINVTLSSQQLLDCGDWTGWNMDNDMKSQYGPFSIVTPPPHDDDDPSWRCCIWHSSVPHWRVFKLR
jgi:hypothetical protein